MRFYKYIIILIVFYSCSSEKKKVQALNESIVETKKRVFFKWPKDGSTVGSPVFIDMGLEGMKIEPAGKVNPGYGHHHILINQKFWPSGNVIPMSDSTLHYGKGQTDATIELDPGEYIISLQFADGVHASFGEEMSASIKINVE